MPCICLFASSEGFLNGLFVSQAIFLRRVLFVSYMYPPS